MKRFPAFLSAFVFALILWAAVNLSNEFQTTLHIKTDFVFPEGKTSRTPLPRSITVTVKATGWQLVQLLYAHPIACNVDIHDIDPKGTPIILRQHDLLEHTPFPADVHVLSVLPDSFSVTSDEMFEKTVPVIPDIAVDCKNGFEQIGAVHADPEYVRVSGARSIVDGISGWRTKLLALHDIALPIRKDVPVSDSLQDLVNISQSSVTVSADVQEIADKKFEAIPIHVLNAPPDVHIILNPSVTDVWLRGGVNVLAHLSPKDIRATVDYYALADKKPDSIAIDIAAPAQTIVLGETPREARWFVQVRE